MSNHSNSRRGNAGLLQHEMTGARTHSRDCTRLWDAAETEMGRLSDQSVCSPVVSPRGKWKNISLGEIYDLTQIYEWALSDTPSRAWSLIENLDSITRDDYLDKTVYSVLEKYFA